MTTYTIYHSPLTISSFVINHQPLTSHFNGAERLYPIYKHRSRNRLRVDLRSTNFIIRPFPPTCLEDTFDYDKLLSTFQDENYAFLTWEGLY